MNTGPIGNQPQTIQGVPGPNSQQTGQPVPFGSWQVAVVQTVHPYLGGGAKSASVAGSLLSKRKVARKKLGVTNGLVQQAAKLDKKQKAKKSARRKRAVLKDLFLNRGPLGLVAGAVGLLVGGLTGVNLGGKLGDKLVKNMGLKLPDKEFKGIDEKSPNKVPHTRKWMKALLKPSEIRVLTLEQPTAMDINRIENITNQLGQRIAQVRNSSAYHKSKDKFQSLDNAPAILSEYVARAKDRAFPNVAKILDAWESSENTEKRDQELRDIVNLCTKDADLNSFTPLKYLGKSVVNRLPEGSEFAKELEATINKCMDDVLRKPLQEHEKALQAAADFQRHEAEALKGLSQYAQNAKKANVDSDPLPEVTHEDLRNMAAEQAQAKTASPADGSGEA